VRTRRWWDLDPARREAMKPDEAVARFTQLFDDAVKLRLRSDVPVGTCLSGGLDSSSIVVAAGRMLPHPMRTFSVSYDEGAAFDERPWIEQAVRAAGAVPSVVVPDGTDFWQALDDIVWHQEEPAAGTRPLLAMARHEARRTGRRRHEGAARRPGRRRAARRLPSLLLPYLRDLLARGETGKFVDAFKDVAGAQGLGAAQTLAKVARPLLPPALFEWGRRSFGQGKDLVIGEALRPWVRDEPRPPHRFASALSDQLAWDMTVRFLPSLLRYEDRNSMAFSIETRLPFLDYRLAEFMFALGHEARIEGVETKAILRRAMADRLPPAIVARRDKKGYETPTDVWLRGRESQRLARPAARARRREPAVPRPRAGRARARGILAGRRAIGLQVWRWLHLELWLRAFASGDGRAARAA
jgi:asparagine synthase (glutamine-hydrolysing)